MRSGYKLTLGVITIMILMTLTVGTSYSYYSVSDTQSTPNLLSSCTSVSYFSGSNNINLDKAYPITDTYANANLTPYNFTIKSSCTGSLHYQVYLYLYDTDYQSSIRDNVKYSFDGGTASYVKDQTSIATANAPVSSSEGIVLTKDASNTDVLKINGEIIDKVYYLTDGYLNGKDASKSYNLRLWISKTEGDQNDMMGTQYKAKIVVVSTIG